QAGFLGGFPGLRACVEADHDIETSIVRIERVGVSLTAVTDNGNLLAFERIDGGVELGIHMGGHLANTSISRRASSDRLFLSESRPGRGSSRPRQCGQAP